jgi:MoxR-like ATPase
MPEPAPRPFVREQELLRRVRAEVSKVVVGQEAVIDRLLIALLCSGHVLIEGVPGLAKTLLVSTLARTLDASFNRIQFTPDLLPGDLVGTQIFHPRSGEFHTRKGPVFAQIILADEINRSPAKVQSALLEAMQEKQVTIGDESFPLEEPFMVLATQNPIEQEGTYPLPEAQLDRFLFKVVVGYPTLEQEREVLRRMSRNAPSLAVDRVADAAAILEARRSLDGVFMKDTLELYVLHLVDATRHPDRHGMPDLVPMIRHGASPRASIYLAKAAKARAVLEGRDFVIPADIEAIGAEVLRHRIALTYKAQAKDLTTDQVVDTLFRHVPIPS